MSRNRDEKYIHKNKLETEPERKKKFGREFAEIPKDKHYVGGAGTADWCGGGFGMRRLGVYPRRAWRYAVREAAAEICEAGQVSGKQRS